MGLPAAVPGGVARTAAHIDKSWIGTDAETLMSDVLETPVALLNDADAAGLAEMEFGAGQGRRGLVMMLTLGTGIGSALFIDGTLVPNTELGHLEINGSEAEEQAASSIRKKEGLSWDVWAVDTALKTYESLLARSLCWWRHQQKHEKFAPTYGKDPVHGSPEEPSRYYWRSGDGQLCASVRRNDNLPLYKASLLIIRCYAFPKKNDSPMSN